MRINLENFQLPHIGNLGNNNSNNNEKDKAEESRKAGKTIARLGEKTRPRKISVHITESQNRGHNYVRLPEKEMANRQKIKTQQKVYAGKQKEAPGTKQCNWGPFDV